MRQHAVLERVDDGLRDPLFFSRAADRLEVVVELLAHDFEALGNDDAADEGLVIAKRGGGISETFTRSSTLCASSGSPGL